MGRERTPMSPPDAKTWGTGALLSALLIGLALLGSAPATAQTDLGGQRVATSSGTFLKIGLDARGAALAGTYNSLVQGPAAIFYNPAAILRGKEDAGVNLSLVQWPGDMQVSSISLMHSLGYIGGRVAVGAAYLGTSFDETTEFYPTGTGRSVGYSDFLGLFTLARNFTDKLGIGVTVKYLREDMGSNVGGPAVGGWLVDAGTVYALGYRNSHLSVALEHFGPDLTPGGGFTSRVLGTDMSYSSFSPPTQFHLGLAIDPWTRGDHRLTTALQVTHQADNAETLRGGIEYWYRDMYALRSGYDFAADEMGFSAGLGWVLHLGDRRATVDYSFTEGGNLSAVHRWSLGFGL
jgi:hypothetical protein